MLKEIQQLLPLQELDRQIYQLKSRLEEFPRLYQEIEAKRKGIDSELEQARKDLERKKVAHKELEVELGKKESDLRRLQGQLFQVKSNKEYTALQDEIAVLKEEISRLEDQILTMLDEIEGEEAQFRGIKQEKDEEKKALEGELSALRQEEAKLKAELEGLLQRRNDLAKDVDKALLERYERILEHRGGIALARVGKDGVCGACYRALPPQVVNELMLEKGIIQCETCGCILYYAE